MTEAVPELLLTEATIAMVLRAVDATRDLEHAEELALSGALEQTLASDPAWPILRQHVQRMWRLKDHLVLRGLPASDGRAALVAGLTIGRVFRPYRGGRVVKQFTASPWTDALSHTLDEGHFHTDLNTADVPPAVTVIQCVVADPGGPARGHSRVARATTLLEELDRRGSSATLSFLCNETVTMVNDSSAHAWVGRIVDGPSIRFHPETLLAAERRTGRAIEDLAARLAEIREVAMSVSTPIHLGVGDALLVSNRRALHYRAACTVKFRVFPRDFEARSVYVLHLMDEAA